MTKLPAILLYTGDWKKDPQLSHCSPATRGIWIDAICSMHELRSGSLEGTPRNLARDLRCTETELAAALHELHDTGAAVVTQRNEKVTLTCRRMQREWNARNTTRLRVANWRARPVKPQCNGPSSSTASTSTAKEDESKDTERAAPPRYLRPTIEEVLLAGAKGGLPEHECRKFHAYYESNGWRVGRNPMKSLGGALATWRIKWEESGGPNRAHPSQTAPGVSTAAQGILHQKELERVETALRKLSDQASHDAFGPHYSPEQVLARQKLRARRAELLRLLNFSA